MFYWKKNFPLRINTLLEIVFVNCEKRSMKHIFDIRASFFPVRLRVSQSAFKFTNIVKTEVNKKVLMLENARGVLPTPYSVHGISCPRVRRVLFPSPSWGARVRMGCGSTLSWFWLGVGWGWGGVGIGQGVPCHSPGWGWDRMGLGCGGGTLSLSWPGTPPLPPNRHTPVKT